MADLIVALVAVLGGAAVVGILAIRLGILLGGSLARRMDRAEQEGEPREPGP